MAKEVRAVVVGGGIVGVSTLYHLAKKGWTDSVLFERKELTSGSTWHAAGLLPLFNLSHLLGRLHQYSLKLYKELEAETGQPVGFRQVSNIRLARTQDRMDEYLYYSGIAETLGVECRFLTPAEVKEVWPLVETDGILGAIRHLEDGYIQPADLTQALARGARDRGAAIHRQTAVTAIERRSDGRWLVRTDKGDYLALHVVSCTGNFARRTGRMVGLDVPAIPVEHQYIVTEPHPEIVARRARGLPEMGVLRESDSSWYMREEAGGFLLGPYEKGAPVCYADGPDENSEYELFQEDIARLEPHIETAIARVPAFGEVGVKKVYNGAISYTPDGSPLIGPAWGLKNFWLNEGHSFGITEAGGAGFHLAEWIVEGEPAIDMAGADPRRFGPDLSAGYLRAKNEEAYRNLFTIHYPDEERAAGRPLKTAPCYERMKALGAVFGAVNRWERANWFMPDAGYGLTWEELNRDDTLTNENHAPPLEDGRIVEKWSFRRSNYFPHVGAEVRNVHENAGLLDMTSFAKAIVSGPGARAWLEKIFANRIPRRQGRIALCHLLTAQGGVQSEFTVYEREKGVFYLVSAAAFEFRDHDILQRLLPADGSVRLRRASEQYGVLVLAGPRARDLLSTLTNADIGDAALPWLSGKPIDIGLAGAHALRMNFIGEPGYELHHPISEQNRIFDALMAAGGKFGLKPFGIRAMETMRLEKSYRAVSRELSTEYSAYESGLERFVRPQKDFIGRAGLMEREKRGRAWRFVTLEVHGVTDADARGSEPVYKNGALIGRATSGGYGWRVAKSLALAMVKPEFAFEGNELSIKILGCVHKATVIGESPFDPENLRLRG